MKREEQKAQREEEILITALELFTKKGYAATKTSEISKAVGISEGLLFHYFKSKEGLLEALVAIALKENKDWIEKDPENPLQYFKEVIESVFACIREDEIAAKFFILITQLKQQETIPEHIKASIRQQEKHANISLEILIKGQKMGQIREGNSLSLLYLLTDTIQAVAVNMAKHKGVPLPEVEWILDIIKSPKLT